MRSSSVLLPVAAAMLVCSGVTLAQDSNPAPGDRPRIGLVLGGGGARGAAHIGVLQELERLRIPVDAIAGTSMGAIVGSLYASGKTPDELEKLVADIDWTDAFVDSAKREELSFRRKQDDAAFPVKLELGLKHGELVLPRGLIQAQKLQLILRDNLSQVSNIRDFDKLPTPFRAVASDIETGEAYVMSGGDLALAARASMSAPGIFSPVTVDGHTLVDGGLVGNLPVSVVRDMGVDIIIAVNVEFPLYAPEKLQSALAISEQMLTILIRKETERQITELRDRDILIQPELGEYGSTNFEQIADVVQPGAAATLAQRAKLSQLALSEEDYAKYRASRSLPVIPPQTVDFVRIRNSGPFSERVLRARLETQPGDLVNTHELAEDASRIYALDSFEYVGYQVIEEDGQTGVVFDTRTKSWGPNFLKFSLAVEDDFEGSTAFNFAARLTATGLNSLGAEWRNDLQLGTEPRFESEFYQPLSFDSRYFVAPRVRLEQGNFKVFANEDSIGRYRVSEAEIGFDAGRELGRWGEFRVGAFRGTGNARVKTGDPFLPNLNFENGGTFARFGVDTLDDAQLPKSGMQANVEWRLSRPGLGADRSFDLVEGAFQKVWSWGESRNNTLQLGLEYATTLDTDNDLQDYFQLGGFLRLSGLERGAVSGPHAGLAKLVYYRRVQRSNGEIFDMPLYFGGSLETGNVWQRRADINGNSLIVNGSLFAGIDTYFGLVFLGAGFSEQGESNFYLFLGNPRR